MMAGPPLHAAWHQTPYSRYDFLAIARKPHHPRRHLARGRGFPAAKRKNSMSPALSPDRVINWKGWACRVHSIHRIMFQRTSRLQECIGTTPWWGRRPPSNHRLWKDGVVPIAMTPWASDPIGIAQLMARRLKETLARGPLRGEERLGHVPPNTSSSVGSPERDCSHDTPQQSSLTLPPVVGDLGVPRAMEDPGLVLWFLV